jgi:predicted transcriptional regulator
MTSINVELSQARIKQLDELAVKLGITKEALAALGIEDLLNKPEEEFQRIVEYVLKKNAELYKRLAA